jgi:hypothetical protein
MMEYMITRFEALCMASTPILLEGCLLIKFICSTNISYPYMSVYYTQIWQTVLDHFYNEARLRNFRFIVMHFVLDYQVIFIVVPVGLFIIAAHPIWHG